jgi:serine/threonine-protein kinase
MATAHGDRNFLFGVLALQMNFVGKDALLRALQAWVLRKPTPLGPILVEQGALRADELPLLEAVVQKHLERHGNDPGQSLAGVTLVASVRHDLEQLADPDVQASLHHVTAIRPAEADSHTTAGTGAADATPPPAREGPATPRHGSAGMPTSAGLRFRVLRPHAKGGLGQVSVALDQELGREVALKEILPRHADHPESRARFLREAEVTGRLEHPGIVPVYGLGLYANGRPYYAMRLIEGASLQDAIRRFQEAEQKGRPPGESQLELRLLLGRFVAVCQAVAYAHSRGVLHRDLKPGNVMVGRYGETLVVDWGLAKVLGRAEGDSAEKVLQPTLGSDLARTQAGSALGTPQYMSPEQALGRQDQLGPASDIYGLGATLYCLLTGRPPVVEKDPWLALQQVSKGEFPPPRQVNSKVPRALEAICLKAMAFKPEERYATAGELAKEVERWLADEPVQAWREPWTVKLRRWVARHRVLVSGAAAAAVVGLSALALLWGMAERQKGELEEANTALTTANERERASAELARQTIEDMTSPEALRFLERQPELRPEQRQFLERAVAYYRQLVAAAAAAERDRVRQGKAFYRMGYLLARLNLTADAKAAYAQAVALWEELAGDFPAAPQYRQELANSRMNLGTVLKDLGERGAARQAIEQALAVRGRLAADFPAVPRYRQELANSHNNLGTVLAELGERAAARQAIAQALRLQEQLATDFPAVAEYRLDLAHSHHNQGRLLQDLGEPGVARQAYQRALGLLGKLAADFPAAPLYREELAQSHNNLGTVLHELGEAEAARQAYQQALTLQRKLAADFPAVPRYRQELAKSYTNLGQVLGVLGEGGAAQQAFQQALTLREQLAKDFPAVPMYRQELARGHTSLGGGLWHQGDFRAARQAYQRALSLREKLASDFPAVPEYRQELAHGHNNLGLVLRTLGEVGAARQAYQQALRLQEQLAADFPAVPQYRQDLAHSHNNLGLVLRDLGERGPARQAYEQALRLQEQLAADFPAVPQYRQELAHSHMNLGVLLRDLGERGAARQALEQVLRLQEQLAADFPAVPRYRQDLAKTHNNLGNVLRELGEREAARQAYQKALTFQERLVAGFPTVPGYRVDLGGSYCNFGILLAVEGQPGKALNYLDKAVSTLEKDQRTGPGVTAQGFLRNSHVSRAKVLTALRRHAEAVQDWDRALALNQGPLRNQLRLGRAANLAQLGQHARATAEVEDILTTTKLNGSATYDVACVFALAAAKAKEPVLTEQYAARAVALLRDAAAKGFRDVAHMQQDTDLDALRQRQDFQEFLRELKGKAPPQQRTAPSPK